GADEPLHTVDVEGEVLTAGGDDLIVEKRVAVTGGEVRGDQIVAVERGQNADHHDPGVQLARFPVRIRQGGAQLLGKPVENPTTQPMWSYVDFQIEHGEFCLEISARNPLQYLRIHHSRQTVGPDQVQLDLHTHEILGAIEPLLRQQPSQSRQTLPQFVTVELTVGQAERPRHDLLPHRSVPPRMGRPDEPATAVPGPRMMMPRQSHR
ncbi:hypothetical protein STRIP9103_01352, partial [Streptomyces ipomoeae 91-03]